LELDVDFAILNPAERDEMMSGLGIQEISLGDRSKVRHHFDTLHGLQASVPFLVTAKPNSVHSDGASRAAQVFIHEEPLDDDSRPSIQRVTTSPRRTQDTQGVSSDSIALMATATLGILSFAVQARVSANERKQQADLDRETAERDKEQTKAGKLLERVEVQLAEFIEPGLIHILASSNAWNYMADAVGLEAYLAHYQYKFISQPATPDENFTTIHITNPKTWRAIATAPLHGMYDADAEMLQGDVAKRQLYADLVEATYLPPLRAFCEMVATKSHLAPWFNPARLDKALPGLGQSWANKSSLMIVFCEVVVYARQFEAVMTRMKAGDNSLLAPTMASLSLPVMMALPMMKDAVSKKELALLGASQGKGTAAATEYMRAGAEPQAEDT
jgi:hypothetical protein